MFASSTAVEFTSIKVNFELFKYFSRTMDNAPYPQPTSKIEPVNFEEFLIIVLIKKIIESRKYDVK